MKLLPDSNIWVSGFATRGLCADLLRLALSLHGVDDSELLTCATVRSETMRILREKFGALEDDLALASSVMAAAREIEEIEWTPPPGFPDPDDGPILGAAIAAEAGVLVTGDRKLLELHQVSGVLILPPRPVFERLRGLS